MSVVGRREKAESAEGIIAHERVVGCEYMGIVVVCVWLAVGPMMRTALRSAPVLPLLGALMRSWACVCDECLGKRMRMWEGWRYVGSEDACSILLVFRGRL